MVYDNEQTADIILERLKIGDPFSYIRFGDGDFIAMYPHKQNKVIGSSNKSLITKEIQDLIKESYQVNESITWWVHYCRVNDRCGQRSTGD